MFLSSLLASNAFDAFEPVAKWLTVAVVAALLIAGLLVFLIKRERFGKFAKIALFGVFCYLLLLAVVLFALDIAKHYSDAYAEKYWLDKNMLVRFILIPLLVLFGITLLSLICFVLIGKYRPERKKFFAVVGGILCGVALIAALVCIAVYYNEKIANDGYYNSDTANVEQIALYLSALLTAALIVGLTAFDKEKFVFDSRALSYAGICAAMSYALSYIKLWDMPQGGSVTLVSLLPITIYAYAFGAKKGVFLGFVYGTLQAIQDPWLIHPAQFLLDYPIAFAAVGLAGLLKEFHGLDKLPQVKFTLGALIAGTLRFVCHVLSGVFAFSVSAEGQNVWAYSLAYNVYVFIDIALVIVAGCFVFSSKSFLNALSRIRKPSASKKAE